MQFYTTRCYPRAKFYDYNSGDFFITVCSCEKKHYFGEIWDGEMHLSELGLALQTNLSCVSEHFNDVSIPLFVVMPNHFHAIVSIQSGQPIAIAKNLGKLNQLARLSLETNTPVANSTHHNSRLSVVVGSIKAAITRYARQHNIAFGWQSRYHDHIIRDVKKGRLIADYILNNVTRWESDCYNLGHENG